MIKEEQKMTNMIQNAKDQVLDLTEKAYQAAVSAGQLPGDVSVRAGVEIPKDTANGDYQNHQHLLDDERTWP